MRATIRFLILCLLILPLPAGAEEVTYPTASLDISTHGKKLHFIVELATSEAQHEHGLMFRKNVPDKHGMLFIFAVARPINFWMKNTLVPLDMLFIDDKGRIIHIAENTVPESVALVPSGGPARAVLEVAGGTAAHYHITPGDRVVYPLFP